MAIPLFSLLLALASYALADIHFTAPAAAASLQAGSTITMTWQDSGVAPSLADLTNYVINLCAGGNTAGSFLCTLSTLVAGGVFSADNSATATIPAGVGADAVNG